MIKNIKSLFILALISVGTIACSTRNATVNVLGQQIVGNHLLVRLESLVYVRSWGGHGTGAEDQAGYIATFDLENDELRIYGPLFSDGDDVHWQNLVEDGELIVREDAGSGEIMAPVNCSQSSVLVYSPNNLLLGKPDSSCLTTTQDEWLISTKDKARKIIGPNGGVIDKITADGKYYLPSFEERYYRGDPAQSVSPQGGEFRKEYTEFSLANNNYSRTEFGFYFERGQESAILYPKRCQRFGGQDRTLPISVKGELRFVCKRKNIFEISTPAGEQLNAREHKRQRLTGFMHSPSGDTVYWIKRNSVNGMDALDLISWNYESNDLKEKPISFNHLFRKSFFSGTYKPIKPFPLR